MHSNDDIKDVIQKTMMKKLLMGCIQLAVTLKVLIFLGK